MFTFRWAISQAADGRFAEGGRGAEDAFIMPDELARRLPVGRAEAALELHFDRLARVPLVPNSGRTRAPREVPCLRQAASRQRDVLGKFLAARDHPRLVIGREPHRLSLVELRVLKRRQPE